jgi:hypothetical protein
VKLTLWMLGCAVVVGLSDAAAYEIETHADVLTGAAVTRSLLRSDPLLLKDLGLDKSVDDPDQQFKNSDGRGRTIRELVQDGSRFEDKVSSIVLQIRPDFA